ESLTSGYPAIHVNPVPFWISPPANYLLSSGLMRNAQKLPPRHSPSPRLSENAPALSVYSSFSLIKQDLEHLATRPRSHRNLSDLSSADADCSLDFHQS